MSVVCGISANATSAERIDFFYHYLVTGVNFLVMRLFAYLVVMALAISGMLKLPDTLEVKANFIQGVL